MAASGSEAAAAAAGGQQAAAAGAAAQPAADGFKEQAGAAVWPEVVGCCALNSRTTVYGPVGKTRLAARLRSASTHPPPAAVLNRPTCLFLAGQCAVQGGPLPQGGGSVHTGPESRPRQHGAVQVRAAGPGCRCCCCGCAAVADIWAWRHAPQSRCCVVSKHSSPSPTHSRAAATAARRCCSSASRPRRWRTRTSASGCAPSGTRATSARPRLWRRWGAWRRWAGHFSSRCGMLLLWQRCAGAVWDEGQPVQDRLSCKVLPAHPSSRVPPVALQALQCYQSALERNKESKQLADKVRGRRPLSGATLLVVACGGAGPASCFCAPPSVCPGSDIACFVACPLRS